MIASKNIRFRVDPGDVPADKAARRLHLTLAQFYDVLPKLLLRGFPAADPDTGMFDLDAIDAWRKLRNPKLWDLPITETRSAPVPESMGQRFARTRAAKHGQNKRAEGEI
jgi:hypothetical protein